MAFPQASDYRPPIIPDGETYDNPENGRSYYWTQILLPEGSTPDTATSIGGYWTVVCEAKDSLFVLKAGDTMTGELELNNAQRLYLNSTKLETRVRKESLKDGNGDPALDGNGNEQWDGNEERFIKFESLPPHLLKSDGTFSADTSEPFGIDIEIDDGNTFKNQLKVSNRNGSIVSIASGTGPEVKFGKNFPGNQDPSNGAAHWEPGEAGGIKVMGLPTPTKENPNSSLAANKGYVDQREAFLQNEIIELAEEIDAIAPSIERGQFVSTTYSNAPRDGEFMLVTLAGKTLDYGNPDIVMIQLSKVDNEGVSHTYADVEEGQLIQLFEDGNSDYGLYLVESIAGHDDSSMTAVTFTVSFVSGVGQATEGDLARLKIFSPPEGGDPDGFVLKTGDEMTGNLSIDTSEGSTNVVASLALKGTRPSTANSAATIAFENDQSTNLGYLTYRSYSSDSWFGFNRDIDLNNNKLHNVAEIRMQSDGYIGISTAKRLILRSGGSNDGNNAATEIQRPGDNKRTFAIKGKAVGSSSTTDFFWAYGNSGSGGDAINYTGLTTQGNHIATKQYVDSVAPTYKITKSGGNYYVS